MSLINIEATKAALDGRITKLLSAEISNGRSFSGRFYYFEGMEALVA